MFTWPNLIIGHEAPDEFSLTYAARGVGRVWEGLPSTANPMGDLDSLIGRTRAAILRRLDVPMTTTHLARDLHQRPEGADPASCGLCSSRAGVPDPGPVTRALGFSLALFGIYAVVVYAPILARRARSLTLPSAHRIVLPLVVGLALAATSELVYRPPITLERLGDEGYLWRFADQLPALATSSLVFWALVPLGALAFALLARRAGWLSLPTVYLATFLASTLVVRLIYQKYFDPFVLLGLILLMRPADLRSAGDYTGIGVVVAGSLVYAAKFYV